MVCTAARSTARLTVNWPSNEPQTTAEPARVVAKLVIGDGVVTTQRRPPFSDHNASVVDAQLIALFHKLIDLVLLVLKQALLEETLVV